MFARSSKSAFVCLECQTRLARRSLRSQWLPWSDGVRIHPHRRWQSAAAALAEDVQEHEDDLQPRLVRRPNHKYNGDRHWRPKQTARLGVSSLGRPAEVLLLDERDRRIPEAPAESEDGHKSDVLTEAWDTQIQSLSPEQLTQNIEHIRDQFTHSPEEDREMHRKKLRKRLQEGFSAKQLRNYIEQNSGRSGKPFSEKRQMARYIFKNMWNIHGREIAEAQETAEVETSRQIMISADTLEVLLLADSSYLRQVSSDHKVQIDFFRQPAKIFVSGPSSAVKAARAVLLQVQSKIKSENIDLQGEVDSESAEWPGLSEIRQRYRTHFTTVDRLVKVFYHVDTPPDFAAIRRHLLLAQRQVPQLAQHSIWPGRLPSALPHVFLGLSGQDLGGADCHGKRLTASPEEAPTPFMQQMSDQEKAAFSDVYAKYREDLDLIARYRLCASQSTRVDLRASFGQALISEGDGGKHLVGTPMAEAKMSFMTQIPLLIQFLAERKRWKDDALQTSVSTDTSISTDNGVDQQSSSAKSPSQFKYELVLKSVRTGVALPSLKIQLMGADVSLGLQQPLQIKLITAVFAERSSHLLLPSRVVDIRFESQILLDIYREGVQPDKHHAKLLSQLAEYFNQAGSLQEEKFAPFTLLNIPNGLRRRQNGTNMPKDELDEFRTKKDHEYVLVSAEAIDVASYRPPFSSKLCLDHVVFTGDDRGDGRQSLQLAEHPRDTMHSKKKTAKGASFFNSAYEIALLLGNPALLRKS